MEPSDGARPPSRETEKLGDSKMQFSFANGSLSLLHVMMTGITTLISSGID